MEEEDLFLSVNILNLNFILELFSFIGDIETLDIDPNWNEYFNWAKHNKLILQYFK